MGDSAGWWPGATGRGGTIGSENGLTSEASHQRASVSAPPPERKASAMLEEAADNQPFGGCLEGHPTWPLSPGQGKASRALPEGQGVGPCWPGPSRAQSQRASPTSLARNTVFPFYKDGKGTSGPRLSSLDSEVLENWLSYQHHQLRPQSTIFFHQKRPTSGAVRAVLALLQWAYGLSGLVSGAGNGAYYNLLV